MKLASIVAVLGLLGVQSSAERKGESTAALSIPVTVVNGAAEPVPTSVKGTAQVAGTVGLAAGTSVGISGTPSVNVISLPAVQLAGTPTVNVGNFPPGDGGGSTDLVWSQVFTISPGELQLLGPVDVSAYREVRVIATAFGLGDYQVAALVVDESGLGLDLLLDANVVSGTSGSGTTLFTVPGRLIKFVAVGPSAGSSTVGISVYGR